MNINKKNICAIEQWLDENSDLAEFSGSAEIVSKIDFLERALELLRIEKKYLKNHLAFEDFLQGHLDLEDNKLIYVPSQKIMSLGSGTRPILLQPKLLVFLLLNHRNKFTVYEIIDTFINTIWDELEPVDFKKTATGVTRCYTNTRFAAKTLRNYGLLKFSKDEAYKTWTLSLSGFLVASEILEQQFSWEFIKIPSPYWHELHPGIMDSIKKLNEYPNFVTQLFKICDNQKANGVFETFKDVLNTAHNLLKQYWKAIKDENLSKTDRQKQSKQIISQLEQHPQIDKFYSEFASCIYVDHYIQKLLSNNPGKP